MLKKFGILGTLRIIEKTCSRYIESYPYPSISEIFKEVMKEEEFKMNMKSRYIKIKQYK